MEENPRKLTVRFTSRALRNLDEIWIWNAERYSVEHADRYLQGLNSAINSLSTAYLDGRIVPSRTDLRYLTVRRKGARHGHLALYLVHEDDVEVVAIFHTAQNWQRRI
jgi:plasmid stabilization system protein ParE